MQITAYEALKCLRITKTLIVYTIERRNIPEYYAVIFKLLVKKRTIMVYPTATEPLGQCWLFSENIKSSWFNVKTPDFSNLTAKQQTVLKNQLYQVLKFTFVLNLPSKIKWKIFSLFNIINRVLTSLWTIEEVRFKKICARRRGNCYT